MIVGGSPGRMLSKDLTEEEMVGPRPSWQDGATHARMWKRHFLSKGFSKCKVLMNKCELEGWGGVWARGQCGCSEGEAEETRWGGRRCFVGQGKVLRIYLKQYYFSFYPSFQIQPQLEGSQLWTKSWFQFPVSLWEGPQVLSRIQPTCHLFPTVETHLPRLNLSWSPPCVLYFSFGLLGLHVGFAYSWYLLDSYILHLSS